MGTLVSRVSVQESRAKVGEDLTRYAEAWVSEFSRLNAVGFASRIEILAGALGGWPPRPSLTLSAAGCCSEARQLETSNWGHTPLVRVIPARPDSASALAVSLVALQQRAYAVEASLIGDNRIPLLHQNVAELCAAGLSWLIAIDDARRITRSDRMGLLL